MEVQLPLRASIFKDRSTSNLPSHKRPNARRAQPNVYRVRITLDRITGEYETRAETEAQARTNGVHRYCDEKLQHFDNRDFERLLPRIRARAVQVLRARVFREAQIKID